MNIRVTPSAKEALQNVEQNQMIQLSFDREAAILLIQFMK